ncbi:hypothetical protein [Streptomyces mirabilis]|nr:hypothetical protein [Streptomyces mirabilis]MCX4608891.1 hypothetical protein [Streptomyces mirabilis]
MPTDDTVLKVRLDEWTTTNEHPWAVPGAVRGRSAVTGDDNQ